MGCVICVEETTREISRESAVVYECRRDLTRDTQSIDQSVQVNDYFLPEPSTDDSANEKEEGV